MRTDREFIGQVVREILSEQFGVEVSEIVDKTSMNQDLNADSLDVVELVMAIEDKFELSIPDEQADNLVTVRMIVDYIERGLNDN